MQPSFYKPASVVTGPAYSPWFKMLATLFTFGLIGYGISFAMRFSLEAYGWGVILLMLAALAGPVGVALLAAVQLRDAGAVNAARAAIADARASQAAEWLEHSAESLTRLEEQLASATARMAAMEAPVANHSSAIAGVALGATP